MSYGGSQRLTDSGAGRQVALVEAEPASGARLVIGMIAIKMMGMTMHLFKTRSKSLLNIFTVSEAIVQVSRVVLARGRGGK